MLSQKSLREFADRLQTSELNVMREYLQHLLLSHLYQHPQSEQLAFTGGTALRLLFGSPRFSEDLDFSGHLSVYHARAILQETVGTLKHEAIPFTCLEAKPTSGGYFASYRFALYGHPVDIEWNLSLRGPIRAEPILVTTPMIPHYQCMVLPIRKMVQEKMEALLRRKKPRDFFDLYFLLRERRGLDRIIPLKDALREAVRALDPKTIRRELKLLLPIRHHAVLAAFPRLLMSELERL